MSVGWQTVAWVDKQQAIKSHEIANSHGQPSLAQLLKRSRSGTYLNKMTGSLCWMLVESFTKSIAGNCCVAQAVQALGRKANFSTVRKGEV